MLKMSFRKVLPGQLEPLRSWMAELMERREEVLESYVAETVRSEQAWIIQCPNGPVMVFCVEADDLEEAANVYRTSELTIDLEHQAAMRSFVGDEVPADFIFKITRD